MTTAIRGTGALLDPPGDYRPSRELVGEVAFLPAEHDGVRRWCPPVDDQGTLNACVAYAVAAGLYARAGVEGRPQVLPSRMALWWFARSMLGRTGENAGVRPTDMFAAIAQHGFPPEWAWSTANPWNRRPDQEAMRMGVDQHEVECGRIVGRGLARRLEIQSAVVARYPLPLTIAADEGYAYQRTGVWSPRGPFLGWHEILGVRYVAGGLETLGSYGYAHGRDGYTVIPWDILEDDELVQDPWAIRLAPAAPSRAEVA